MEWPMILDTIKPGITGVVILFGIIGAYTLSKRVTGRLNSAIKESEGFPKKERTQLINATRDDLIKEHLSHDLQHNYLSTLLLVVLSIPFTVILAWIVIRAALRGIHFIPFYVLLGCAVIVVPILISNLISMQKIILEQKKRK